MKYSLLCCIIFSLLCFMPAALADCNCMCNQPPKQESKLKKVVKITGKVALALVGPTVMILVSLL